MRIGVPIIKRYFYMLIKPTSSITIESQSFNKTKPTFCKFRRSVWNNLPKTYQQKALKLVSDIATGKPYSYLGGVRVKCNRLLIRFRVGRSHRLVFVERNNHNEFLLFNRQEYEKHFHRIN